MRLRATASCSKERFLTGDADDSAIRSRYHEPDLKSLSMKGLSFQVKRQVEQPDRGIPIPKQIDAYSPDFSGLTKILQHKQNIL